MVADYQWLTLTMVTMVIMVTQAPDMSALLPVLLLLHG